MKLMLNFDTIRGRDSTGIACVRANNTVQTVKHTVPGWDFVEMPDVNNAMGLNDKVWIGHNRWPTQGKTNRLNAHPFEVVDDEGDVLLVGAHNGTLNNKYDLPDAKDFGTDSEALFHHLYDVGPKVCIPKLRGAWALTWFDTYENKLYFLRNEERPLHYARTKDKKSILWASEAWMMQVAAARFGIELDTVFLLNVDTLVSLDIPKTKQDLPDLTREGGLKGAEPLKNNFHNGWSGTNQKKQTSNQTRGSSGSEKKPQATGPVTGSYHSSTTSTAKTNSTTNSPTNSSIPAGMVKGFEGKAITSDRLQELKSMGCYWCDQDFKKGDPVAFLSDEDLVCQKCLNGSHHHSATANDSDNNVILLPSQRKALEDNKEDIKKVAKG